MLVFDVVGEGGDALGVGDVEGVVGDVGWSRWSSAGGGLAFLWVSAGEDDVDVLPGELAGDFEADASVGSCD